MFNINENIEDPVKPPFCGFYLGKQDDEGNTPLSLSCIEGDADIIEILCSTKYKNVGINVPNNEGDTPLLLVCKNDCRKAVECLIKRGANIHHVNNNGKNSLMIACKNGHLGVVEELMNASQIDSDVEEEINENEIDPNDLDKNDNSALSLAVNENHFPVVKYLLDNFGDILTERVLNHAYSIAEEKDFQEMMEIIPHQPKPTK